MKKNTPSHNDEIDLIALAKIIWDGKIKILLITIILYLVGIGYSYYLPKNYMNSLSINITDNLELMKLEEIERLLELLQSNQSNQSYQSYQSKQLNQSNQINPINQKVFDRFIDELIDREEFLLSIKNLKKIEDQEIKLFKYAKLLKINIKNDGEYIIQFTWHDPDEALTLFKDTLNLTSKNLKNIILRELMQKIEFEKKIEMNQNKARLVYLKEQSSIAKELKIIDNQMNKLSQSNVFLNISMTNASYYLRGYKAIDKEINLLQNRDYQNFYFIEKELETFRDTEIKFLDYNINLMNVESLKNTKLILMISILLGLIIGVLYVLILNVVNLKLFLKKK